MKYDPQKCTRLALLREEADLSQQNAATYFDLKNRDTIAAWEKGTSRPQKKRRAELIVYLWDKLRLRQQPETFAEIWQSIVVEEWQWDPLNQDEQATYFRSSPTPKPSPVEVIAPVDELPQAVVDPPASAMDTTPQNLREVVTETSVAQASSNHLPKVRQNRYKIAIAFLCLLLLIGFFWWLFSPEKPRLTAENPGEVLLVSDLSITPAQPKVGELITAEFQVKSNRPYPYEVRIAMSSTGPNACWKDWKAPPQSWPRVPATLYPDKTYTYRQSKIFETPGSHFGQPSLNEPEGRWTSIPPHVRQWFEVLDQDGRLHHPDCVVLVDGLAGGVTLSSSKIRAGETITLTYSIRNDQPEAFSPQQLTAEIRTPDARQATFLAQFPAQEGIVLEPGEQYTYQASRSFHTPGEYLIEPFYRNEHYWRPIWPYSVVRVEVGD